MSYGPHLDITVGWVVGWSEELEEACHAAGVACNPIGWDDSDTCVVGTALELGGDPWALVKPVDQFEGKIDTDAARRIVRDASGREPGARRVYASVRMD